MKLSLFYHSNIHNFKLLLNNLKYTRGKFSLWIGSSQNCNKYHQLNTTGSKTNQRILYLSSNRYCKNKYFGWIFIQLSYQAEQILLNQREGEREREGERKRETEIERERKREREREKEGGEREREKKERGRRERERERERQTERERDLESDSEK